MSLAPAVVSVATIVGEPASAYADVAGAVFEVAALALSAEPVVVHTSPLVNAFEGAVPGAVIVWAPVESTRISPGASWAQVGAWKRVPAALTGHLEVRMSTPPRASAGSAPTPLT